MTGTAGLCVRTTSGLGYAGEGRLGREHQGCMSLANSGPYRWEHCLASLERIGDGLGAFGCSARAGEQRKYAAMGGDVMAEALREHLRSCGVHARYLTGFDLDGMTAGQLGELHDDMPVMSAECSAFPGRFGR